MPSADLLVAVYVSLVVVDEETDGYDCPAERIAAEHGLKLAGKHRD